MRYCKTVQAFLLTENCALVSQPFENQLECAETEKMQLRDSCRKIGQRQESTEDKLASMEADLAMMQAKLDEAVEAKADADVAVESMTFKMNEMERDLAQVRQQFCRYHQNHNPISIRNCKTNSFVIHV